MNLPGQLYGEAGAVEQAGGSTSTSGITAVPVSAADTKGSWVQLIAATTHEWQSFNFISLSRGNQALDGAFDISIGGAGSEANHMIVENLAVGANNSSTPQSAWIPVRVPAGSRISARAAYNLASDEHSLQLVGNAMNPWGMQGYRKAIGIGVQSGGPSGGTTVTFGASNAKGSYAQLTGSLSDDIAGFLVNANPSGAALTSNDALYDIAVGAASSERVIVGDVHARISSSADLIYPMLQGPFWHPIAAGTRVAARGQNVGGTQDIGMSLLGFVK